MKQKRLWAMLLSAALIVTQLPAVAMAENAVPQDGSIASFEELPGGVKKQTVTVGTSLSELNLPDTVTATVYRVTEDTVIPDEDGSEDESGNSSTATPSDAKESVSENSSKDSSIKDSGETVTTVTTSEEEIPVTWDSEPAFDGDTEGKYVFTADAGGYTLSSGAKLPQITVTVSSDTAENPMENPSTEPLPCAKTEGCTLADGHEGECVTAPPENDALVKTITGWTFVDDENLNGGELALSGVSMDNQVEFDTVVSMLPAQISATIEGAEGAETLDITDWSCDGYKQDDNGNWPLTGDYTFTAALPEGYACDLLPKVKVVLGGATLYANDEYDGLTITAANGGSVSQAADRQITLNASGDYEISGTWGGTLDTSGRTNKAVITVPSGVTAKVTLSNVTIDVSGTDYACAFAVANGGTANITLSGTNTLASGDSRAGLEVPETAAVTIDGNSSLEANGGSYGAGIGGGSHGAGGTINIIGGTVNANGISGGAGIGGGLNGAGGTISIDGGTVTANSSGIDGGGAGIGGGAGGSSGDITIGGRAEVTAAGSSNITMKTNNVSNGTIRIGGDAVVNATGGSSGAGIGGGGSSGGAGIGGGTGSGTSNNGRVEISGNAVVNAIGGLFGAGIGGGSSGAGGTINIIGGTVNATGDNGGSLSVTDGATLEMATTGTNVTNPVYVGCTIKDKNGTKYYPLSGGGSSSSGGGSSYSEPEPQSSYTVAGDNISRNVSRSDLKKLADSGKSLTLHCDKASMTFDPAALKAILAAVPATAGNITFAAAPADLSAFPDAAKQLGAHPVYDFTISYKDGNGNLVTVPVNFPAGSAAITLNYTPAAAEVTGSLFMTYVDGKGAVTWLDKSSYDNGKVLADAPHFSTYGVAYKAPAPVFTDISGHWAKLDIEFVAARGLLSGTGNGLFSPDGAMTRGMFVTALGRLAGVNPADYQTRSFDDVKADAYYAAYVEWAAQKNIVKGTGDKLFSPDAPVTREQMAVMMTNYAGQMGHSISTPLASVTFADSDKISVWAAKEVTAMQRAGIVKGKDGNRFDPQGNATRAEASAVLRRFVEIVIDPATATGWVKNDSGHWLYYKGGKALTGWQTIGKLRYFFNADGVMHEGWKQDTDTNKWYYWTNAGAATGWREIDGKWYYFNENGVMAVNTKVDGYEVGPDGARK